MFRVRDLIKVLADENMDDIVSLDEFSLYTAVGNKVNLRKTFVDTDNGLIESK